MRRLVWLACVLVGCSARTELLSEDVTLADTAIADAPLADAMVSTRPDVKIDTGIDTDAGALAEVGAEDGGAVAPKTLATLVGPLGIAVGGGYVYVASLPAAIRRLPIGGGPAVIVAKAIFPTRVSVDSTHVYWTDGGTSGTARDGRIGRVPIAGGAEEILVSALRAPRGSWLFGGRLYFSEPVVRVGDYGSVSSVPVGGGSVATIADLQPDAFFAAANATHVCWAAVAEVRCKKDGIVTHMATGDFGRLKFVAVDDSHVYYVTGSGRLERVPLTGGSPVAIDAGMGSSLAADIALDATHAYWSFGNQLRKVPKSGGTGVPLFTGTSEVLDLAIDATHIYWVSSDDLVRKLPK